MGRVAIVQARMGSTRLPGKVMKPLAGRPMLELIVERLAEIASLDRQVVATSVEKVDDVIAELVESLPETELYRGSEEDVLRRFHRAASVADAGIVLRVTADNPLVDPPMGERLLQMVAEEDCDYAANNLTPTFPVGLDLEAFTFEALEEAHRQASSPCHREHVTPYLREHPEQFEHCSLTLDWDLSHLRFTVDTREDYERMRAILDAHGPRVRFLDIVDK